MKTAAQREKIFRDDPVSDCFLDKRGVQICELDVLKVFHFTGARNKKHYVYKWVRRTDKGELAIMHLSAPDEQMVPLRVLCKDGEFECAEIVQSVSCRSFAKCGHCGGFNTHSMQHDAAHWFCADCKSLTPSLGSAR